MRPGPGLVVMALAFISGARRGSTNTSSKTSSSSSSSATSSPSSHSLTTSNLFPSYLGGGAVLTPTDTATHHERTPHNPPTDNRYHHFYHFNYPPPAFVLPAQHPRQQYDDPRTRLEALAPSENHIPASTRTTRGVRSSSGATDERSSDLVGRAGGGGSGSGSDVGESGGVTLDEDTSDSSASYSNAATSEGLPVQFRTQSADSSKSFDDDDILALVAEDDLLSEESFDRLTKLTDDKIGYINEEDYSSTEGGSSGVGVGAGSSAAAESVYQLQDENRSADVSSTSGSRQRVYAASLLSNSEFRANALSLSHTVETVTVAEEEVEQTGSPSKRVDLRKSLFESAFLLTRINPWISACDLSQPGSATDLQGQCSAGSLPVAWVDEGPGPPTCPKSCEQNVKLRNKETMNNFNIKTNNNKVKYLINTNTISFKSNHHNNNYDNKLTMKVRRDVNEIKNGDDGSQPTTPSATAAPAPSTPVADSVYVSETPVDAEEEAMQADSAGSAGSRQSRNNNNIDKARANSNDNADSFSHVAPSHHEMKYSSLRQDPNQHRRQDEQDFSEQQQQQCLDYLGDTVESSPAHLCGLKSPGDLLARLRALRLRNCCERNVFSALHTIALNVTLSGGAECVRLLQDLMELDLLATRITCELAEILFRFDCRQMYSLINQCDDCKETYRRWVCSTLIPYFAEQSDVLVPPGSRKAHRTASEASDSHKAASVSNQIPNVVANKNIKLIDDNNNNKQLRDSSYGNWRNKRQIGESATSATHTLYDIIGVEYNANQSNGPSIPDSNYSTDYTTPTKRKRDADVRSIRQHPELRQQKQQQSNNFISTANSEDPYVKDPVISKLLKRIKRKVEFRKRRRIRPCLSVCQTVEQKCPYLLPADRAPALPTQYAGEPTFLCLDQNIPETGEQLRKSSYGPHDCCYAYCSDGRYDICTYCEEFAMEEPDGELPAGMSATRRVHNITITANNKQSIDSRLSALMKNDTTARGASIAIALKNATTGESQTLERLLFYAYYDGTYYYDDANDIPQEDLSDDCPAVPIVTSKCTTPYYASATKVQSGTLGQQLLVWLGAILCLLSSFNAAQLHCQCSRNSVAYKEETTCKEFKKVTQERKGNIQLERRSDAEKTLRETLRKISRSGSRKRCRRGSENEKGKGKETPSGSRRAGRGTSNAHRHESKTNSSRVSDKHYLTRPVQQVNNFNFSKQHFCSKFKLNFYRSKSNSKPRTCNICINTYSNTNSCNKNYRFFYYYNFNINDWWRRWWIRMRAPPTRRRSGTS